MKSKVNFSKIIATFFGVGLVPFAPGTFGSVAAFPFFLLITYLISFAKDSHSILQSKEIINYCLMVTTALFFIGMWATQQYCLKTSKEDPKEVVIDEVVGQMLAICFLILLMPSVAGIALPKFAKLGVSKSYFELLNLISIFIFFRLFDIFKPWPIDYIDKNYKNSFGVMFDDIVAAIFAVIFHFFVLYAILDYL